MRAAVVGSVLAGAALAKAALTIPPEDFGFPAAPNNTALSLTFMVNGAPQLVQEGELLGIGSKPAAAEGSGLKAVLTFKVPVEPPLLALDTAMYTSLQTPTYQNYVVIMVDPDASYPETHTKRFILHWIQGNLTKSTTNTFSSNALGGTQLISPSDALVPYAHPSPPANSSAHRYILYAFEQPTDFAIPSAYSGLGVQNRTNFNFTDFIAVTNLGTPAAAMYYYCTDEMQVPANFTASAGATYPGGNGAMVTTGTGSAVVSPTGSATSSSSTGESASGSSVPTTTLSGLAMRQSRVVLEQSASFWTVMAVILSWIA